MSLNNIQLPPVTLVNLYRNNLVSGDPETGTTTAVKPEKTKGPGFLGNNKKQIAVIVDYSDAAFIPDEQLLFLTNILTACKLSLDDIAIINFNKANCSYKQLQDICKAKTVLLFGLNAENISLPLKFPNFQVQLFDGVNYLSSPSLEIIEKEKPQKSQLWSALKKLFQLN
jgi:hypothetical protein